jgi:hypothetical protein
VLSRGAGPNAMSMPDETAKATGPDGEDLGDRVGGFELPLVLIDLNDFTVAAASRGAPTGRAARRARLGHNRRFVRMNGRTVHSGTPPLGKAGSVSELPDLPRRSRASLDRPC